VLFTPKPQSVIVRRRPARRGDLAISLGGDADTMACIAGAVAEAYYGGVPRAIEATALSKLDDHLREILRRFRAFAGA
jgi:ADP-ribosylglycohydrolase